MTVEELEELVAQARYQGCTNLYLVVTRDAPPRGNLRVTGFGTGVLLSTREREGRFECTCAFKLDVVEASLARMRADPNAFRRGP